MRKARLGFKIFSLDNELIVEEDKDFERKDFNIKLTRHLKDKARKLKNYNNHKEKYNAQRRAKASTIDGKYHNAKRKAIILGYGWEMDREEWIQIWIDAGFVIIPGTVGPSNPSGVKRTAFSMRGPNKFTDTLMARTDTTKPWSKDNAYIIFRSAPLVGSQYHCAGNET